MRVLALFVLAGVFKGDDIGTTDMSTSAVVHGAVSVVLMVGLIVSAWVLRAAFKHSPGWEHLRTMELVFAIVLTVTFFVASSNPEGEGSGLTQRLFVGLLMLWLGFVAWQVRNRELIEASQAEPAST